jgi:hypothetical protein
LLAESKLVISFDPLSNLHYESTLLGTPVHVVDDTLQRLNPQFNLVRYGFRFADDKECPFDVSQALEAYEKQIRYGNRESVEHFLVAVKEHFLRVDDSDYRRRNGQKVQDFLAMARRRQALSAGYVLRNVDEPRHLPAALFQRFFPWQATIANIALQGKSLLKALLLRGASRPVKLTSD